MLGVLFAEPCVVNENPAVTVLATPATVITFPEESNARYPAAVPEKEEEDV